MYISSMSAPAKKTHRHRPGTVAVRQYHRYQKILPMVVQLQTFVFWSFWEAPQISVPIISSFIKIYGNRYKIACRLHRRNDIGLIKNRCVDLCDISSMNAPAKKTHKHRPGTVAVRQYHRYRKILPMVVQLQTFVFWSFWEAPQICVPSCRLHRRNYILA